MDQNRNVPHVGSQPPPPGVPVTPETAAVGPPQQGVVMGPPPHGGFQRPVYYMPPQSYQGPVQGPQYTGYHWGQPRPQWYGWRETLPHLSPHAQTTRPDGLLTVATDAPPPLSAGYVSPVTGAQQAAPVPEVETPTLEERVAQIVAALMPGLTNSEASAAPVRGRRRNNGSRRQPTDDEAATRSTAGGSGRGRGRRGRGGRARFNGARFYFYTK